MTLTRAQRRNLDKLATYLESLPRDYRHFHMEEYLRQRARASDEAVTEYARHNGGVAQCGTVACAVGHGPAAGILFRRDELDEYGGALFPDWSVYSERFVPRAELWARCEPEFDWAFGSAWSSADNHHWGAAARIRYLLKHGGPPEGFRWPSRSDRKHYREFDKRHAKVAA